MEKLNYHECIEMVLNGAKIEVYYAANKNKTIGCYLRYNGTTYNVPKSVFNKLKEKGIISNNGMGQNTSSSSIYLKTNYGIY